MTAANFALLVLYLVCFVACAVFWIKLTKGKSAAFIGLGLVLPACMLAELGVAFVQLDYTGREILLAPAVISAVAGTLACIVLLRWMVQHIDKLEANFDASCLDAAEASLQDARIDVDAMNQAADEIVIQLEERLTAAREALESGKWNDARNALETSSITTASAGYHTGNITLDCILQAKSAVAQEQGCAFEVAAHMPSDTPLDDVELTAVVANLVDNALNEATRSSAESPVVAFTSKTSVGQMLLVCTNPCDPKLKGDLLKDRKQTNMFREHGWGLGIVQHVAEHHGGYFELTASDGTCEASVMIPLE